MPGDRTRIRIAPSAINSIARGRQDARSISISISISIQSDLRRLSMSPALARSRHPERKSTGRSANSARWTIIGARRALNSASGQVTFSPVAFLPHEHGGAYLRSMEHDHSDRGESRDESRSRSFSLSLSLGKLESPKSIPR
jgi:hypothetical protein